MTSLEKLTVLLADLKEAQMDGLNYQESLVLMRDYGERFEQLYQVWLADCERGIAVPYDQIRTMVEGAVAELSQNCAYRFRLKMPNPYGTTYSFRNKLNFLKFELDKRAAPANLPACHCQLRLANRIQPNFTFLRDYGRAVLYHEDDDFIVKECRLCNTRWIDATVPGALSMSNTWTSWNPEEYLLREVF